MSDPFGSGKKQTIITADVSSNYLLGDQKNESLRAKYFQAIMANSNNNAGFYKNFVVKYEGIKGQFTNFYRYGKNRNPNGLPYVKYQGIDYATNAPQNILDSAVGGGALVQSIDVDFPSVYDWVKFNLQSSPTNFNHLTNTFTHPDAGGIDRSWELVAATADPDPLTTNEIALGLRSGDQTYFWVEGSQTLDYGSAQSITVKCNRAVPTGETVTVNLNYSGCVNGIDFTAPASVTLNAGETEKSFTLENISNVSNKLLIQIDPFTNTSVFDIITLKEDEEFLTVELLPNNVTKLVVLQKFLEFGTSSTVDVMLVAPSATGAFTVDCNTYQNSEAEEGVFYTDTSQTLNFTGTPGEIVTFNVTGLSIPTAGVDEYPEFGVQLSNSSNGAVDISDVGRVVLVEYVIASPAPDTGSETVQVLIPETPTDEEYLSINYTTPGMGDGDYLLYLYALSDRTHGDPTPDDEGQTLNDVFPVVFIRRNEDWIQDSDDRKDVSHVLRQVGTNFDELRDAVRDATSSEERKDVVDIYVTVGVSAKDSNRGVSALLWELFTDYIVAKGISSTSGYYKIRHSEDRMRIKTFWRDQDIDTVSFLSASSYGAKNSTERDRVKSLKINGYCHWADSDELRIFKRISETEVQRIWIKKLFQTHHFKKGKYWGEVKAKPNDERFLLPVRYEHIRKIRQTDLLRVYPYIIRMNIQVMNVQKVRDYGGLIKVLYLIAIIVSIVSMDFSGTWVEIVTQLARLIATNYAATYAAEKLSAELDDELLGAIIVVAAIALAGEGGGTTLGQSLQTIDWVLKVVTDFAKIAGHTYSEAINEEADRYKEELEGYEKELSKYSNTEDDKNDSILTASQWAVINSADTYYTLATEMQYDYNQAYNYDTILGDYFETMLRTGVK